MQLTEKQKKYLWIIPVILVLFHFAPRYVGLLHREPPKKPSPIHVTQPAAPVKPINPAGPAPIPDLLMAYFSGVWTGQAITKDFNLCQMRLEMRPDLDDPSKIKGFETRTCAPYNAAHVLKGHEKQTPQLVEKLQPVTAVLTGTTQPGKILFTVDQVIGTHPGDCPLNEFNITTLGMGQLSVDWREGICASGNVILNKKG